MLCQAHWSSDPLIKEYDEKRFSGTVKPSELLTEAPPEDIARFNAPYYKWHHIARMDTDFKNESEKLIISVLSAATAPDWKTLIDVTEYLVNQAPLQISLPENFPIGVKSGNDAWEGSLHKNPLDDLQREEVQRIAREEYGMDIDPDELDEETVTQIHEEFKPRRLKAFHDFAQIAHEARSYLDEARAAHEQKDIPGFLGKPNDQDVHCSFLYE